MPTRSKTSRINSSDMVASTLLERVLEGEWQVGDKIPSIDQLEAMFPVSRATISKGIQKLCRKGYLRTAWRSGTYVRSNTLVRRILLHVGGDQNAISVCPFSMVVTRKLERLLAKSAMQTEIHWEGRQPLSDSRLAGDLADRRFDGAISVQSNLPAQIEAYLPALLGRLPMVHVGIHHQTPWVFVDMEAFNRQALAHCTQSGARRILYFSPDKPSFSAPQLELLSLEPADGDWPQMVTEDDAFTLFLRAWHRLDGQVDAVVVTDDLQAKGIAQAVLSMRLEASDRLQIISLTNKDSGLFYPLPITAIEVDTDEVVDQAFAMFRRQLDHGVQAAGEGVNIAPRLVADTADALALR